MNLDFTTAGVYGIYGSLGGGKSLTAVDIGLDFLDRGYKVFSNIQFVNLSDERKQHYTFCPDFSTVNVEDFPIGSPRGTLGNKRVAIIIDEAAEFFDQYSSTSVRTKDFLSWLRHSSKLGQFVFLIVQDPSMIAKSLRLLVYRWVRVEDLAQYRIPMLRIKIPFMGNFVWRRQFDKFGNRVDRGWDLGDKFVIGHFYRTSQTLSVTHKTLEGHNKDINDDITILPFSNLLTLITLIYLIVLILHWT